MRERLIRSILVIVALTVLALGVPLSLLARFEVDSSAQEALQQQAVTVAGGLEDLLDAHAPITAARVTQLLPGRRVLITTATGQRLTFGSPIPGAPQHATVHLSGATITVEESRAPTDDRLTNVTLFVIGLSAAAIAGAVALAIRQARLLVAPLDALAARADAIGYGDFDGRPFATGIPEVDAISRELERSATRIGALIGLQRDFASDAAHHLRTPLTGIGLRLEEIVYLSQGPVRQEAEAALTQVERLNGVIGTLLARARGDAAKPEQLDAAPLIRTEALPWERVLTRYHRALLLDLMQPTPLFARREHVETILAALLDNALIHGSGSVTISTSVATGVTQIAVTDMGPGIPIALGETVFDRSVSGGKGTGIGLALARSLARSEGGDISFSATAPARLVLRLPSTNPDSPGFPGHR